MSELLALQEDEREDTFECLICYKQIKGETQYKIHMTTPQHLKKEEAQSINELIPPPTPLPVWKDIVQYLNYLKLDEPIIGLDSLVQLEDAVVDGKPCLKYRCKMCNIESIMCTMVSHIVSRKHRHRYMQLKRPDLLNKHGGRPDKQPGLVARAKAAIVEKQDGWGTPSVNKRPNKAQNQPRKTPVLKSLLDRTLLEQNNLGPRAAKVSHSYTPETSVHAQDWRGQTRLNEDARQQSFSKDIFGKPAQFHGGDMNDHSRADAARWQSYEKNDQPEKVYYHGNRQRPYQEEGYKAKSYIEGDGSVRSFVEGDVRHHTDRTFPRRSFNNEPQDDYYSEMDSRRGWNPGGDVQQNLHHESVPRNRFADTERSSSFQFSKEMDYQVEGQIQGQMYALPDGRGHGMEEMQRPSTSFQYMEKDGDYLQDIIKDARAGTYKMQDYAKSGLGDYTQEHGPAKKKRQSRFSDATPKEVELAHKRFKESVIPPKNQSRGLVQAFEERNPAMRTTINSENVLDVLDEVQIDSAEEAKFLKQKLCDVLKEFHANKGHRAEVSPNIREYSPRSDTWIDQRWSVQETRKLDDFHGFQETKRYDHHNRNLQERRIFTNDSTDVQETWRSEKNTRDDEDPRFVEDQRSVQDIQGYERDTCYETTRYENSSTDFQGSRGYEAASADLPQARRFEEKPRDFQSDGHFKDNRMAFQPERGLYDNSMNVQWAGRFENNRSAYQQASSLRAGHVKEEPRNVQSTRHIRGTEENKRYEAHFKREVGRHDNHDFMQGHSDLGTSHQFGWNAKRERLAGQSVENKDYHLDVDKRAYPETRSLTENEPYSENEARMPRYQRTVDPNVELYDPFHPSSSPPPQAAPPPSSLEKLASTLLELVSRNSN